MSGEKLYLYKKQFKDETFLFLKNLIFWTCLIFVENPLYTITNKKKIYNNDIKTKMQLNRCKDTVVYFASRHRCCKNINKLERRLCMGSSVRTLGFMDAACTCHQAMLLRGRSSIVILDGNLISSCQSEVKYKYALKFVNQF